MLYLAGPKREAVLELLSGVDQALFVRRNSVIPMNASLQVRDTVGRLGVDGQGSARKGLYEQLHGVYFMDDDDGVSFRQRHSFECISETFVSLSVENHTGTAVRTGRSEAWGRMNWSSLY